MISVVDDKPNFCCGPTVSKSNFSFYQVGIPTAPGVLTTYWLVSGNTYEFHVPIFNFFNFPEGGADPKSPVGTAAAFSKPNRKALLLANNSILFEYASNEIMDTLKER